jgi:acetyl-CoA carboxylase beta subunit
MEKQVTRFFCDYCEKEAVDYEGKGKDEAKKHRCKDHLEHVKCPQCLKIVKIKDMPSSHSVCVDCLKKDLELRKKSTQEMIDFYEKNLKKIEDELKKVSGK